MTADRPDHHDTPGSSDPGDARILAAVGDLWTRLDPVPPDLVERVVVAVALDDLDGEVARLLQRDTTGPPRLAAGTRSRDGVRTLTFSAHDLSVMVQVTRTGGGRRRLDGWVEPPGPLRVELRHGGAWRATTLSAAGRFLFVDLDGGTMQLRLSDPAGGRVVTPMFEW